MGKSIHIFVFFVQNFINLFIIGGKNYKIGVGEVLNIFFLGGGCLMNKYGAKIRELREKNNDTLEELAEKLNMTYSSLGKYERGERKITPELLESVSNIYEEKLSYFYGEEQEPPEELKKIGAEWVAFAKEMEEKNLTPEEIKAVIEVWKKLK